MFLQPLDLKLKSYPDCYFFKSIVVLRQNNNSCVTVQILMVLTAHVSAYNKVKDKAAK